MWSTLFTIIVAVVLILGFSAADANHDDISAFTASPADKQQSTQQPVRGIDVAGYHSTSLTHIFLPFMESQLIDVKHLIQHWWGAYKPCERRDWEFLQKWRQRSSGNDPDNVQTKVKLALVVGRVVSDEAEESELDALRKDQELESTIRGSIRFCESFLECLDRTLNICVVRFSSGDATAHRDRRFYEMMLKGQCVRGRRGYAFFLEPNTFPVAERWLTNLATAIAFPAPASWLIGPAFRGNTSGISSFNTPALYHMNRNQLVRLSNDLERDEPEDTATHQVVLEDQPRPIAQTSFAHLYFDKIKPFWAQREASSIPVDEQIFGFMMQSENWNIVRGMLFHRMRFTNLILDISGLSWTPRTVHKRWGDEDVVLVHGYKPNGSELAELPSQEGCALV